MSDRSALLAAVLAAPDDDLPRLVFADWLEETGDPADAARAAFIRLEVEADRYPTGSTERMELDRLAAGLLRAHLADWNRELPGWIGPGARVFYRRGFPHELQIDYDRFSESAAELFDVAPVRVLELTAPRRLDDGYGFVWELVRRPEFLARVRRLGLSAFADEFGHHGPPHPRPLCRVPSLTGLRALDVGMSLVDDDWVTAFVRAFPTAAFAGTLEELLLPDNSITDAGALALAAAPGLDRLRVLDVRNNRMSPLGLGPLRARFGDRVQV